METKKEDARVRKTKQAIVSALNTLLETRTINEISVQEISTVAGINKTTFYNYYTDVNKLVKTIEDQVYADIVVYVERVQATDPIEIMASMFEYFDEHADYVTLLFKSQATISSDNRLQDLFEQEFEAEWMTLMPGVGKMEAEYQIYFAISGFIGIAKKWILAGRPGSVSGVTKLAETIILRGMNTVTVTPDSKKLREAKRKLAKLEEDKAKQLAEFDRKKAEIMIELGAAPIE